MIACVKKAGMGGRAAIAVVALFMLFAAPTRALAQCEAPGSAAAAAGGVVGAITALLNLHYLAVPPLGGGIVATAAAAEILAAQAAVEPLIAIMETRILNRMRGFWDDWFEALQQMTQQMSASIADQTRQFASMYDSSSMTQASRTLQRDEIESRKQYHSTPEGCQFDTASSAHTAVEQVSKAMTTGMAADIRVLGNNNVNSPARQGAAALQKTRWDTYTAKFCDGTSNGGAAGCPPGNPLANAHILPSKTLFGKETYDDLTDPDWRLALSELAFNISGYSVPDPLKTDVMRSPAGKEQRQRNREYLAQMDAVGALIFAIVGERTPGPARPDIQETRLRMGASDASATPSAREVRRAMIERLQDPAFYVDLTESPSTITQREIYLQAYNLMLLYQLVEKTEKIATVVAVETANMVEATADRSAGLQNAPVRP